MDSEQKQILAQFRREVNMTAGEIEKWLETAESKEVGQKKNGAGESTGHKSGKRIVELLRKKQAGLTAGDFAHMRKVVNYIGRHSAQRPDGDTRDTPWRYSLKNWGHDPDAP